jgi:hypothetical protein
VRTENGHRTGHCAPLIAAALTATGPARQTDRVLAIRILVALIGLVVVAGTFLSALRTVVLPRAVPTRLARAVFVSLRHAFDLRIRWVDSYEDRDAVMATYGPFSLIALLVVWLTVTYTAFVALWWAIGESLRGALELSGSSLTTLGFQHPPGLPGVAIAVAEAIAGLVLLALLITYLPALYSAFKSREFLVSKLEVRAGQPPSGTELVWRFAVLGRTDQLGDLWRDWEDFFIDIEESHTSFPALTYFRSPQPGQSWVTASGAVLDGAALLVSSTESPSAVEAQLTLRAGSIALRRICTFYGIPFPEDPQKGDPISVTREEYEAALDRIADSGTTLKQDREAGWLDFAGWRVNYDATLLALAALTMAPYAQWSSDRSLSPGALTRLPLSQRKPMRSRMDLQLEREREQHRLDSAGG